MLSYARLQITRRVKTFDIILDGKKIGFVRKSKLGKLFSDGVQYVGTALDVNVSETSINDVRRKVSLIVAERNLSIANADLPVARQQDANYQRQITYGDMT